MLILARRGEGVQGQFLPTAAERRVEMVKRKRRKGREGLKKRKAM